MRAERGSSEPQGVLTQSGQFVYAQTVMPIMILLWPGRPSPSQSWHSKQPPTTGMLAASNTTDDPERHRAA